jgi:hypothetical protein
MRVSALLAVLLAGLAVAVGAAAEPPVVLRWNAPSECPGGDRVLDDARSLAGNRSTHPAPGPASSPTAQSPSEKPVEVEGVVERLAADRWAVTLTIGAAQRRIEAASCAQVARAAALFVALVMDPSLDGASFGDTARGVQGEAAPDAGAADAATPAPSAPRAAPSTPALEADAPNRKRVVSVLAAAGLMLDVGTVPRAELLGEIELGIRYRRFEVTLQGAIGPNQDKTLDGGVGVRMRPQSAMLVPCFAALVLDRFRLAPCARSELGWIHAQGIGVSEARSTDAIWVSVGGELSAWWVLGANVEARIGVGALFPVVRPHFELIGVGNMRVGSVFEPGVAALRAATAVVFRF